MSEGREGKVTWGQLTWIIGIVITALSILTSHVIANDKERAKCDTELRMELTTKINENQKETNTKLDKMNEKIDLTQKDISDIKVMIARLAR